MTFDSIKRLFTPTSEVVCPRCEKPMAGHDEKACERRMSRRYFFGVAAGAAAAIGAKDAFVPPTWHSGVTVPHPINMVPDGLSGAVPMLKVGNRITIEAGWAIDREVFRVISVHEGRIDLSRLNYRPEYSVVVLT